MRHYKKKGATEKMQYKCPFCGHPTWFPRVADDPEHPNDPVILQYFRFVGKESLGLVKSSLVRLSEVTDWGVWGANFEKRLKALADAVGLVRERKVFIEREVHSAAALDRIRELEEQVRQLSCPSPHPDAPRVQTVGRGRRRGISDKRATARPGVTGRGAGIRDLNPGRPSIVNFMQVQPLRLQGAPGLGRGIGDQGLSLRPGTKGVGKGIGDGQR